MPPRLAHCRKNNNCHEGLTFVDCSKCHSQVKVCCCELSAQGTRSVWQPGEAVGDWVNTNKHKQSINQRLLAEMDVVRRDARKGFVQAEDGLGTSSQHLSHLFVVLDDFASADKLLMLMETL